MNRASTPILLMLAALVGGCGFLDSRSEAEPAAAKNAAPGAPGARPGGGPGGPGGPGGAAAGGPGAPGGGRSAAIPVRVVPVERRAIAQFLETNGTVESDNDVALVARTSGPIVELLVEEGMKVEAGQLLARIDDAEIRARLALAKVNEGEAELAYERAKAQYENEILSRELFDQASAKLEAARASVHETQVQLDYTSIKAPFTGMIVTRFIKFAQHVQSSTPLFRISAFDPLQCPIQVPEKDLGRLRVGQPAHLTVEAFPGERFEARVLRVSPVVDSATGTVKTTLEVETRGRLRPGMFASVFLETDRHADALVIPKTALVLESIGDTVYVKDGEVAKRREVRLGYDEGDHVEVVAGLEAGQDVIVLGQDSLSDGTPIYVLEPGSRVTPSG
jgi:RND family efflux transporter MFP subunit